ILVPTVTTATEIGTGVPAMTTAIGTAETTTAAAMAKTAIRHVVMIMTAGTETATGTGVGTASANGTAASAAATTTVPHVSATTTAAGTMVVAGTMNFVTGTVVIVAGVVAEVGTNMERPSGGLRLLKALCPSRSASAGRLAGTSVRLATKGIRLCRPNTLVSL
ncbi:hypothetical protein FS749_013095, partial [Ceratobasidium sp. UAMH 11750]